MWVALPLVSCWQLVDCNLDFQFFCNGIVTQSHGIHKFQRGLWSVILELISMIM